MAAASTHAAPGTRKLSQCDRILEALADGKPHSMESIHEEVGFCRLNSRIAELRARGHRIVCDRIGQRYIYTLLSPLAAGSDTLAHSGAGGLGPAASGDAFPTQPVLGGVAARSPLGEPDSSPASTTALTAGHPAPRATGSAPSVLSEAVGQSGSPSGVASTLGGTDGSGAAQLSLLGEPSRRELWS